MVAKEVKEEVEEVVEREGENERAKSNERCKRWLLMKVK